MSIKQGVEAAAVAAVATQAQEPTIMHIPEQATSHNPVAHDASLAGSTAPEALSSIAVLRMRDVGVAQVAAVFTPVGLELVHVEAGQTIPGSHWGDDEAGLIAQQLFWRDDTPVHSVFHEACHWLLMDEQRRQQLHTNAGGTLLEECAVCYLQICIADLLPAMNQARMMRDMDQWGYSFRLGSTAAWFNEDAQDAAAFLLRPDCRLPAAMLHLVQTARAGQPH